VPAALLISLYIPGLIIPLLMLGGSYLCYEGVEKIWHSLRHEAKKPEHERVRPENLLDETLDLVAMEAQNIKGAIRTDMVLSAEIIVIVLGAVKDVSFVVQASVVSLVAIGITIGVYSFVAAIVKIDDLGLYLMKKIIGSHH
jgi:predicted DNA repair protein MutK